MPSHRRATFLLAFYVALVLIVTMDARAMISTVTARPKLQATCAMSLEVPVFGWGG